MLYIPSPWLNYGFAIDLRKCIGCHACTIACKSEHDIPVGVNRCWVKTVEKGTFPQTQRLFFPVLCNQCEDAPCMNICPTSALFRRRDGIVDLNGEACIGCRACMAACPYDQLFIDPNTRTAEKCNFCANRVENQLEPACVSVCPTECRIFGDLDDPTSEVAQIVQREAFMLRKPEKGTGPKIFYLGADEAAIRPEIATRPFMFREGQVIDAAARLARSGGLAARATRAWTTTCRIGRRGASTSRCTCCSRASRRARCSCRRCSGSWATGRRLSDWAARSSRSCSPCATAIVLVIDLERPERFYYILTRPNWSSWLARGAFLLTAHAGIATLWVALATGWAGRTRCVWLAPLAMAAAFGATVYTGFLFAQGLARDLWQGPHGTIDLIAQAAAEGSAAMLLVALVVGAPAGNDSAAGADAGVRGARASGDPAARARLHAKPDARPRTGRARDSRGRVLRGCSGSAPSASAVWRRLALVWLAAGVRVSHSPLLAPAAVVALAGGFAWEYIWVDAGQSVPNS